jgi:hypothetical protein
MFKFMDRKLKYVDLLSVYIWSTNINNDFNLFIPYFDSLSNFKIDKTMIFFSFPIHGACMIGLLQKGRQKYVPWILLAKMLWV